jgi:hypothetical protein
MIDEEFKFHDEKVHKLQFLLASKQFQDGVVMYNVLFPR